MQKTTIRQRSIGFVSVPVSIALFFLQWWAEAREMINKTNADVLLWIAIAILVIGLSYVFYPFLKRVKIIIQPIKDVANIETLRPYYGVHLSQQAEPQRFISLEPRIVWVNKDGEIMGLQARVRSLFFEEIIINKVIADLKFPSKEGRRIKFVLDESNKFQLDGLQKGGTSYRDIELIRQTEPGEVPFWLKNINQVRQIEGTCLLLRDTLPEINIPIVGNAQFLKYPSPDDRLDTEE